MSRDVAYNVDGANSRGSYSVTRTADLVIDRAVVGDVEQTLTYNGFGEGLDTRMLGSLPERYS